MENLLFRQAQHVCLPVILFNVNIFILRYLIRCITKLYLNGLAELGDYNPEEHKFGYLSNMVLIPDQTEQLESQISQLHKLHKSVL